MIFPNCLNLCTPNFAQLFDGVGSMDLQNGNRKSLRVKRKNVFLEDHVQSGVVFEGDLESLDDKGLEKSDLEGKYTTYMWKFVQSAPVVTFSIVEQRLSEDES